MPLAIPVFVVTENPTAYQRAVATSILLDSCVLWRFRVDIHPGGPAAMHNEFTAIIEKDGDWFIGYCPEIPGANGQGRTKEECRSSLAAAVELILEDLRQGGRVVKAC